MEEIKYKTDEKIELRSEEVQEIMGQIPSWILRCGISIIALVLLGIIIGSCFFRYPDCLTAPVTITTTNPPVELDARATGRIDKLYISDKRNVTAGEWLAVIESNAELSDMRTLIKAFYSWKSGDISDKELYSYLDKKDLSLGDLQVAYSTFTSALHDFLIFNSTGYYKKKIELKKTEEQHQHEMDRSRKKEMQLHECQAAVSENIFRRDSILYIKKTKSGAEYDNARQAYLQSRQTTLGDVSTEKQQKMQHLQNDETMLDLRQQYQDTYEKSVMSLGAAADQLEASIKNWEKTYVVKAPITGYVNLMGIRSPNQNVTAGDLIMIVMPTGHMSSVGKALLPATGAGRIKVGQRVINRLNNYPDAEFGFVDGVVSNISDIPNKDGNYIVEISYPKGLITNYGKKLPQTKLILGNAQIVIRDKRLIENFIQPLEKIFRGGL